MTPAPAHERHAEVTTAREEILQRVRAALADVPDTERPEDVPVERGYRTTGEGEPEERVARFAERVADYKAAVHRVASTELPEAVARACQTRQVRRLVVPEDLPEAWRPPGTELLIDGQLSNEVLDAADGVLTGCVLGIAETGTIVLDGGPRQGRRAITLLPDYHLCVVEEGQIVGSVPEAVAALDAPAAGGGTGERRPITFVSGPSATSDIELNRVEGVHGPRTLEVLIVG
jgi:L-lactate dehydrogenase complex protein LldG